MPDLTDAGAFLRLKDMLHLPCVNLKTLPRLSVDHSRATFVSANYSAKAERYQETDQSFLADSAIARFLYKPII